MTDNLPRKEFWHINDFRLFERHIAAVSDFQHREFFSCLYQFSGTAGRHLLIPAIPVILIATGREFEESIFLRHEFGIAAELTAHGVIRLAFTENRLCHVCPHLIEALAEPAFRIIKATNHAVVQNAVEIVLPRQVINLDRRPDFYIRHTQIPSIFILCFCVADSIATNRSIKELNSASVSFFASLTEKNGPMVSDHSCSLSRT